MNVDIQKFDQPWEPIDWNDAQKHLLFRDWGFFYGQRLRSEKALEYLTKALDIEPDDLKVLQFRSKCYRDLAETKEALIDSTHALKLDSERQPIALEVCDALHELNRFEENKGKLHDSSRNFTGKKVEAFCERLCVVNENFKDSLGEGLGPFLFENGHWLSKFKQKLDLERQVDDRPLWKVLKEQGQCDVESILEKKIELLSPLEKARRNRAYNVFNQIYFNKNWIDVLFLKLMRKHKNLIVPQFIENSPKLSKLTCTNYNILWRFLKMLHARSPLYNERFVKCPSKALCKQYMESILYRIQLQTRRNMINILRTVRELRKRGDISKLSQYVEEVMGSYVVLKTSRTMPWVLEFTYEMYNTLALAHADTYTLIPDSRRSTTANDILHHLQTSVDVKRNPPLKFIFGDKLSYQASENDNPNMIRYRKFLTHLEKRMVFAKIGIERSYLFHEIARSHLVQGHFEECCSIARKGVEESKNCKSKLWQFLCTMLILKSHATLHKIERCKEVLDQAYIIAKDLNSPNLRAFIKLCSAQNDTMISMKKKTQSTEVLRKRSKFSIKGSAFSIGSLACKRTG